MHWKENDFILNNSKPTFICNLEKSCKNLHVAVANIDVLYMCACRDNSSYKSVPVFTKDTG